MNYIFFSDKEKYTKIVKEKSSKTDYLKFINTILNSIIIKKYIKENKLNAITWKKLKELKIPKINFENKKQVEKYNKIVELANELIKIYSDNENLTDDLIIKENWWNIIKNKSDEFKKIMNLKDFEIIDDILFIVKIWNKEYFGFDNFKDILITWKREWKNIWKIFGLDNEDKTEEIKKLNFEIDDLAKWFYYENDSIPEDYEEDKQGRLI